MLKIVFATHNQNKVKEVRDILKDFNVEIISLSDLNINYEEPEENGKTYFENAKIKALAAKKHTSLPVFADDSGLEVEALDNGPGIFSARFSKSRDEAFLKILNSVNSKSNNKACFVTHICYIDDHQTIKTEGKVTGTIHQPSGNGGFGYDPLFVPDGYKESFASLGDDVKNKISHRAKALINLMNLLFESIK